MYIKMLFNFLNFTFIRRHEFAALVSDESKLLCTKQVLTLCSLLDSKTN